MKLLAAFLAVAGLMLTALPAAAQLSGKGGPIDVSADQLELIDAQHLATWTGKVEALQNGNRLRADKIDIYFSGQGGASAGAPGRNWGPVQRIEASGTVYFVTPQQTAKGDHATYNAGSDDVTITGNVVVAQGQSVVRGSRLVVDLKTNKATMVSEGAGSGRVRGVFYPNGQGSNPLGAPAPKTH
jgi:lipopolysaccharide export system protein LptA